MPRIFCWWQEAEAHHTNVLQNRESSASDYLQEQTFSGASFKAEVVFFFLFFLDYLPALFMAWLLPLACSCAMAYLQSPSWIHQLWMVECQGTYESIHHLIIHRLKQLLQFWRGGIKFWDPDIVLSKIKARQTQQYWLFFFFFFLRF